jgi:hypothetical protein
MTEPFKSPIGWEMNSDFVENITMSFSLWAVVAKHSKKQNSQPQKLRLGADASAIHGRLGCSGCTPAEPYPPSRTNQHTQPTWPNQSEKAIAATAGRQDNDLARNLVLPLNQIE